MRAGPGILSGVGGVGGDDLSGTKTICGEEGDWFGVVAVLDGADSSSALLR